MRKRLLSILLVLCMVMTPLSSTAFAVESTSGTCGDNVTWTLNNGTLTISGNGAMQDYTYNSTGYSWRDQIKTEIKEIKTVVINDGVNSIGMGAFYGCDGLTSVTIPNSVTSIGESAFRDCTNLTSVLLPNGVTTIGEEAFEGCASLSSVTIPNSVISIGEGAFYGCTGLTSVTIPSSITTIGDGVFFNCSNLTMIQVDTGNQNYSSVDGVLFTKDTKSLITYPGGKQDTTYTIPSGVTSIGEGAFYGCVGLTSVTIPNSVTSIGMGAFYECAGLTSATIPNSVTSIGESAFRRCYGLTSITIPSSITSIGGSAFYDCPDLTDVYYTGTKAQWEAIYIGDQNDALKSATIHYTSATSTQPQQSTSFTDVPSSAYYAAPVAWAVEKEITSGTSSTTFSPNQDCTNAQILTFLWRACGKPAPEISNPFTNNIPDAYLQAAVWAYEQGMVSGSTFDTNRPCTRAMAVTYIWQAAGSPAAGGSGFTDVPAAANYAQAVSWAVDKGVTSGTSDSAFSPDNICSRGQIVTFLYRAMAKN